jgi:4'-phosphopantetheinyl transferase
MTAAPADVVDVWLVDTRVPDPGRLHRLLDTAEAARCAGLRREPDRRRFVVAHATLRLIVARRLGLDPRQVRWTAGINGKPEVDGLHVNLSHSGDLAMVAMSAVRPVGVDLQEVLPDLNVAALAARFYPAGEAALVTGPERFAELWTRKEALVKAAGGRLSWGLMVPVAGPAPVLAEHDGPYRIVDLDAPAGFRAAVALAGAEPFTVRYRSADRDSDGDDADGDARDGDDPDSAATQR